MPDIEIAQKIVEIDEHMNENLARMAAEGWQPIPGMKGVAIYPVQRIRAPAQDGQAGLAVISVDETKIKILRNGQLIDG